MSFTQIAGIFEFLGAMVLGGETTKTVASDISNLNLFKDVPEIYMYGMLCSVAVAGTWLLVATYWCLPVSTTHSISEYLPDIHTSQSTRELTPFIHLKAPESSHHNLMPSPPLSNNSVPLRLT